VDKKKTRVFVVNQPMKMDRETGMTVPFLDLSPAEQFGRLIFLLPDGELQGTPEEVIQELKDGLKTFTKDDYLLLAGDPRAIAWASVIAADRVDGDLPMLHWFRSARCYRSVRYPLRGGKVRAA